MWPPRQETFAEYKQSLIELLIWYRDEYHRTDKGGHDELIQQVEQATTQEELSPVEQIIDGWLD